MKKKLTLFLIVFLLLIFIPLILFSFKKNVLYQNKIVEPTPFPLEKNITLIPTSSYVVKTDPLNGSNNIPLQTTISIYFNKTLNGKVVNFSISPEIKYATSIQDNVLIITPSQLLSQGTTYSVVINLDTIEGKGLFNFSFTTSGPKINSADPSSFYQELSKNSDNFQKQNYPDVFLRNKTPYSSSEFDVFSSGIKKAPSEHYYFLVTLKGNKEQSKNKFIDWLTSLELSSDQIKNLDITYQ